MQFHGDLKLWYCVGCGSYGSQQLLALGRACVTPPTPHRAEHLRLISQGSWPKVLSKAEKATRRK
eukprot:7048227-Pyramimonas_sp.AAC.1